MKTIFKLEGELMNNKSSYKTRQQELILSFLRDNRECHVTAAYICAHFRTCEIPIGVTKVYRHLDKMVESGLVQKFITDGEATCYQYIGDSQCQQHAHFHLTCLCCGKLIHMECGLVQELAPHIQEEHDFELQPLRTTFYGTCGVCSPSAGKSTGLP